ncbi:hypothetical protein NPX13_g9333 [Xylaria arbuscula]|uniref:Uncharacterized protein n=1 Tax=Xylaria arbuscula TaxID=114810 RepID=A0A9W8TIJ8_9PEZI|nr:hypothetical protein NPX13_g9333 [Xylaria arbuscula]
MTKGHERDQKEDYAGGGNEPRRRPQAAAQAVRHKYSVGGEEPQPRKGKVDREVDPRQIPSMRISSTMLDRHANARDSGDDRGDECDDKLSTTTMAMAVIRENASQRREKYETSSDEDEDNETHETRTRTEEGEKRKLPCRRSPPDSQHTTPTIRGKAGSQRCRRWGGEGRKAKQTENGNGSNVMKYQAGGESPSGGPGA